MLARTGKAVVLIVVALLLIMAMLPFVLMVVNAFQNTVTLNFDFDPDSFTSENFVRLFTVHHFGAALLTSTVVVVIAVVLNNVVCCLAAFAFTFKPFPGSKILFWVYLATMMVPVQVTMIPMFLIFRELDMLGSPLSLALPVVNAFGVFLIRQFMTTIPLSLLEAARIDGASDLRVFWSVILPIIRPVIVSLTVFTFLTTWNDFMWPLISLQTNERTTVTLAISQLQGAFTSQYGMVMAGTTVAFLVPLVVYVVLQRQFVQGVTASGVKG
ncbi:carbohydrate ABC transporter permease [Propionibacterium sp. NM47_B9-13]|jgi:multiple sugar transport system permease protein|uniref:Sugar ABC transporter permease n=2 Tax=Cutibacterium modestum TaxID=2559073 RepID=A0AAD1NVM5_9ACTN|nr:carbohydrate ABC transporter permease [Cutibacterium modestum]TGY29392.1 carbohydrate ABC transporter permease [Propionibacterium sp. NM47_B9-13]AOH44836.1 sugar ABC transporter permease [Cutibacterium modestum]EFS74858.1 ABC transporter, permease protein [Cutibacterium modestum HL037PA2]EFS91666.1 ABC transporter, permease protein [Cutibacterium modestum HL044PA1]EFT16013.1 ABC transporter, permease protein [Cutibacterium modestum HL037PA3]